VSNIYNDMAGLWPLPEHLEKTIVERRLEGTVAGQVLKLEQAVDDLIGIAGTAVKTVLVNLDAGTLTAVDGPQELHARFRGWYVEMDKELDRIMAELGKGKET